MAPQEQGNLATRSVRAVPNNSPLAKIDDREPTPEEQCKDPAAFSLARHDSLEGGKARAASMTARCRSEIAKAAAKGRWLLKD